MPLLMEEKFVFFLVVLLNFVSISLQASTLASGTYVAAVVEYAPVSGATLDNKEEIFLKNVRNYACLMEEAARQGADVIVFPEYGLVSMEMPKNPDGTPSISFNVPSPGTNPCDDTSSEIEQGLRELSCAAKRHRLYAVVNLPERAACSCPCPGFPATVDGDAEDCPPSGAHFHNTNVVFDRTGNIVARYRKFNLFGESGYVPTQEPEFAIFETDFGVSFATFTCFDILFAKPAALLAREHSVCDFAFPTAWFSEAPFLTAVQAQAAWAHALDVNLLAAGYSKPEEGCGGSGIYLGRNGSLQAVMPTSTTSRLLVGTVPKIRRCQESPIARSRRAAAAMDDDTVAVGQTPLSAFHHIVVHRKYGHADDGDLEDLPDESAPAFIHHKMYEQSDEGDDRDDDSQPPTVEFKTAVPLSSFMGLASSDEAEEAAESDDESQPSSDRMEETDWTANEQEKRRPGTTRTDTSDEPSFSKNPDLLVLYQEDPEEQQLPEEFLEIEVPESFERPFEPERDTEYFKLPDEEELQDKEKAAAGGADLSAPEEKVVDTVKGRVTDDEERESDAERNTTEEEIQAAILKFDWLIDEQNVPTGPITGKEDEAPREEHIDDTDDILADADGLNLLEDGGQDEASPANEEHIDDTDDILADHLGLSELDETGPADEQHIDDTDDVLADHLGLSELDEDGSAAGEQQGAKSTEEVTNGSETDTLDPGTQLVESEDKLKKPDKRRKMKPCRRNRHKQKKNKRKCKPKPKAQEADGMITDEKPVAETSENCPVAIDVEIKPEGDPKTCKPKCTQEADGMITDEKQVAETSEYGPEAVDVEIEPEGDKKKCKPKRPCIPREKRESGCPAFRDGVLEDGGVTKRTEGLVLRREYLEVYKTFTLSTDSNIENSTVLLCDGTFCCTFQVVQEVEDLTLPRYAYRLAVFNGTRTLNEVATGGLQVCALIPCSRDDMDSCGMLTLPDEAAHRTVFRSVSVTGSFSANHTLVAANTAVPGLLPLPADRFNMTSVPLDKGVSRVTLRTTAAVQNEGVSLLTFAIYARVFRRDGEPPTTLPEAGAGSGADAVADTICH